VRDWFRSPFSRSAELPARRRPQPEPWRGVLGFEAGQPCTLGAVETRFRKLAALAHPDRGGSVDAMQQLNLARAEARRQLAR
jgi:hypothetical protein